MPGVGDFNLRSFFRALGIKNPAPSVRETIQPVILAGDFNDIVPQYRAPSAYVGGDTAATVGQLSVVQLVATGEGGAIVHGFGVDASALFRTLDNPVVLDTVFESPHPIAMQLSVEPPASFIQTGSIITAVCTPTDEFPDIQSGNVFAEGALQNRGLWIRPGSSLILQKTNTNSALGDFWFWFSDVPASENSIL